MRYELAIIILAISITVSIINHNITNNISLIFAELFCILFNDVISRTIVPFA